MEKQEQYKIIKAVHEGKINKPRAVVKLGVTLRHVNRLLQKYRQEGKAAFIHGNTGRKPVHALSDQRKTTIVSLYNKKYYDANFVHASQLMAQHDALSISPSALRKLLLAEDVLSPRARRATRKNLQKRLRATRKGAPPKELLKIETKILAAELAHSRRPRVAYFGEVIQMDASLHHWFGNRKAQLHIAIDDSSGRILAAYFDWQETLHAYYHLLHQILTTQGIPHQFLTDRRTVFTYKKRTSPSEEEDVTTQFSYACKLLGIEIRTSSVAQAKGRVERAFQTLQSRLPIEMRLAGITDIAKANEVLNSHIKDFNDSFALPVDYTKSVFVEQPSDERIDQILSVLAERTVDCGQCIRYANKHYRIFDNNHTQVNFRQGTKGLVAKTFSHRMYFTVDEHTYSLEEVPVRETYSETFDFPLTLPQKDTHHPIPPKDHPWRQMNFIKHHRYIAKKYYLEV
jgi:transposase-like protein/transposase